MKEGKDGRVVVALHALSSVTHTHPRNMDTRSQRVPMEGCGPPSPLASPCQDFSISHYSLLLGTLKSDVHPSTS